MHALFHFIAVLLIIGWPVISYSVDIIGHPTVIDGDTIKIDGTKIRLFGIDAPEIDQECIYLGAPWKCGLSSKINLINKIGSEIVHCKTNKQDKYRRYIAKCYINDEDISEWMVNNGFALAYSKYSKKYMTMEENAKSYKIGIWSSEFETPDKYRLQTKYHNGR